VSADRRGFTLFEVLIALAVFGLLVVGLTQGTRMGLAGLRSQARASDAQADLDAVDRVLRQLIGTIDPGTQLKGPPVFEGERHRAVFIASLPAGDGASPSLRAHVLVLVDARRRLVLRWYPYYDTELQQLPARETVLLSDVERIDLSYWAASGWADRWDRADTLPDLLRLHIVFPADDRRRWPDVVVPTNARSPA
jgi:general secretion pathway protein J